jgi:hypothetical protein
MNSTAWEKFQGATLSLARSGALKDRLTDAYRNHLSRIDEAELPKELRDSFRSVSRALTHERPLVRGDDPLRATIRKMSNCEAEDVATSVVRLFCELQRTSGASQRPAASAQVVPIYISESRTAKG